MKIEDLKGKVVAEAKQDGDTTVIHFTDGACFVSAPVEGKPPNRTVVKSKEEGSRGKTIQVTDEMDITYIALNPDSKFGWGGTIKRRHEEPVVEKQESKEGSQDED